MLPYFAAGSPFPALMTSLPSSATLSKRDPWTLDPNIPSDQNSGFTTGLSDAIKIAAAVLDPNNGIDNTQNDQYLSAYFGASDENTRITVKQVFQNLVGSNTDGTGSSIVGTIKVWNDDYFIPPDGWSGVGDGVTPACQLRAMGSGKTLTAYTRTRDRSPGMHFCPKFLDQMSQGKTLDSIISNGCSALANNPVMDTTAMNRNNYAFAILHEFFHLKAVTRDVTNFLCVDKAYGAWSVLRQGGQGFNPYENADSFAWYAMVCFTFLLRHSLRGYQADTATAYVRQRKLWPNLWRGNK